MPRGVPNKKVEEQKDWRVERDERFAEASKMHFVIELTYAEWSTLRGLLSDKSIFHSQAVGAVSPILEKVDRQVNLQQQPVLFPKEIK